MGARAGTTPYHLLSLDSTTTEAEWIFAQEMVSITCTWAHPAGVAPKTAPLRCGPTEALHVVARGAHCSGRPSRSVSCALLIVSPLPPPPPPSPPPPSSLSPPSPRVLLQWMKRSDGRGMDEDRFFKNSLRFPLRSLQVFVRHVHKFPTHPRQTITLSSPTYIVVEVRP